MNIAGLDVETAGTQNLYALQPWRAKQGTGWLTSAVYIAPHQEFIADGDECKDAMRAALRHAALNNITIAGWNTAFDVAWLIGIGLRKEVMACKWLDGMLLWRHLRLHPTFEDAIPEIRRHSYSLKAAVREYLPHHAGYEEGITFNPTTDEERAALRAYNRIDVECTVRLTELFWEQLTAGQRVAARIEAASIPLVADAIVNGIEIDTGAAEELSCMLEAEQNQNYTFLALSSDNISPQVLASPMQLRKMLEDWGVTPRVYTETGAPSTDRHALILMSEQDERCKLIADYREAKNNRTKFAEGALDSVAYNGGSTAHPQPRIYGTYTGRMTYSGSMGRGKEKVATGIALHQWKRDAAYRKLIRPPEGYTLLEFDFAGQEFRWMAVVSGDPTMLNMCLPGEDAHSFMGASIAGLDYKTLVRDAQSGDKSAKNQRQLGKVANLALQYRTSANRLRDVALVSYGLKISKDEASQIHSTYQRTYPGVVQYWNKQRRLAERCNEISNMLGRVVHYHPPRLVSHGWSYAATAINYPIQSMGAEQKYLALAVLKNLLPRYHGRFYFELHDGLFCVVPDVYAERAAHEIKRILSNLPYRKAWGLTLPIPFPVDGKMGPSWGELREFHD